MILRELLGLYLDKGAEEGWIEILAADTWARDELDKQLEQRVHRTQVRRARLALERLGYICVVKSPMRKANQKNVAVYLLARRQQPIVIEILKPRRKEPEGAKH